MRLYVTRAVSTWLAMSLGTSVTLCYWAQMSH